MDERPPGSQDAKATGATDGSVPPDSAANGHEQRNQQERQDGKEGKIGHNPIEGRPAGTDHVEPPMTSGSAAATDSNSSKLQASERREQTDSAEERIGGNKFFECQEDRELRDRMIEEGGERSNFRERGLEYPSNESASSDEHDVSEEEEDDALDEDDVPDEVDEEDDDNPSDDNE